MGWGVAHGFKPWALWGLGLRKMPLGVLRLSAEGQTEVFWL